MTYAGQVAHTYFFSTSGGRTATVTDVWPSSKPIPYLVSVADPHDSISPYHRWGPVVLTAKAARARLKVPGSAARPADDDHRPPVVSGRLRPSAPFASRRSRPPTSAACSTCARPGSASACSRSPVPRRPSSRVTSSRSAGIARGLAGVTLEQRAPGEGWAPLVKVKPGAGGAFAAAVKPTATTEYRLAYGTTARSTPIRVVVAHTNGQGGMLRP